jgi:hypothetical protein
VSIPDVVVTIGVVASAGGPAAATETAARIRTGDCAHQTDWLGWLPGTYKRRIVNYELGAALAAGKWREWTEIMTGGVGLAYGQSLWLLSRFSGVMAGSLNAFRFVKESAPRPRGLFCRELSMYELKSGSAR